MSAVTTVSVAAPFGNRRLVVNQWTVTEGYSTQRSDNVGPGTKLHYPQI